MFTGIVSQIGEVTNISETEGIKKFTVKCLKSLNLKVGDSVAINGACMTATSIKGNTFTFDTISESLSKTNLNLLTKGSKINLELPLKANQKLDGHIVQGHVDETAKVKSMTKNLLTLNTPKNLKKYIAMKGSVTLNGVSLTVSKLTSSTFSVSLIPHTLKTTNLANIKSGDLINLEIDILARYLEQLTKTK